MWAMSAGMNWDWFAEYNLNDNGTCELVREFRLHKSDPMQGADIIRKYHDLAGVNHYEVIEPERAEWGQPRMITGLRINYVDHLFSEPIGRFSRTR